MAWFDYVSALGQGLGQGVEQMKVQRAERRLLEDRKRQQDAEARQQAAEDRQRALEALTMEDPENISPEWITQYAKFAPEFVRKGPKGFSIKESPLAAAMRQVSVQDVADKGATLSEKTLAREAIKNKAEFMRLPVDERLRVMEVLGLGQATRDAYLTAAERRQRITESPDYVLQRERLNADRQNTLASIQGRMGEAMLSAQGRPRTGGITDSNLLTTARQMVTTNPINYGKSADELIALIQDTYMKLKAGGFGADGGPGAVPSASQKPLVQVPGIPHLMEY